MPGRFTFDEVMLLSQARLKILDPELKQGRVEMLTLQTASGPIQRPWGVQGSFAIVYKFRTQSGSLRALRCFLMPVNPDMQFRYERIGMHFRTHIPDITAVFKYHDAGIVVKEPGKPGQNYPIIEMEWIEGMTLVERVDELCRKRDKAALKNLASQLIEIIGAMRQAHIAHGNLSGTNVMVRKDGRLVLVDYDSVYVPKLKGQPTVMEGQVNYQHPQWMKRPFDERMDEFSALVINTALLALQIQPELWDKYGQKNADDSLLFVRQDFLDSAQSPLMHELEQSSDLRVRSAVRGLKWACIQPISAVRFPFHLIDPDFDKMTALENLKRAITNDDDDQIIKSWIPLIEQYQPAQPYSQRVQLAQQRLKDLNHLRREPLFAIARIALEEDDRAFLGKNYVILAGISQNKPEGFEGESFDLPIHDMREPLHFDILVHVSENIQLTTEWQKRLYYDPRDPKPQLVEFTFRIVAQGHNSLDINFYHERRWLRTIHFTFDAVEQSEPIVVSSEG